MKTFVNKEKCIDEIVCSQTQHRGRGLISRQISTTQASPRDKTEKLNNF